MPWGIQTLFNSIEMFKNKRILVVAAHPDDELLGLGATMHHLINNYNVSVHVVILGEGITSRSDDRNLELWDEALKTHRNNIKKAADIIGYQSVSIYSFSDNRFDHHDLLDIIKTVEHEKEKFRPDIIFTHNAGDLNIDHQLTYQAVVTSCRPMADELVKGIITFETPSATEWQAQSDPRHFSPNLYIEVNPEDVEAKIDAMSQYQFETRAFPHPRSSEALKLLASYRGMTVGKQQAEAFQIIRWIMP